MALIRIATTRGRSVAAVVVVRIVVSVWAWSGHYAPVPVGLPIAPARIIPSCAPVLPDRTMFPLASLFPIAAGALKTALVTKPSA